MIYSPRQSDIITIVGKDYEMNGKPFDSYLKGRDDKSISNDYIAKWEIIEHQLYLKDINLMKYKHLTNTLEPISQFIGHIGMYLNNHSKRLVDGCLYELIFYYRDELLDYCQLQGLKFSAEKTINLLFEDDYRIKTELVVNRMIPFGNWKDEISELICKIELHDE